MRPYARQRLSAEIARRIAEILEFEVKDPALRAVTPTVLGVELSADGEEATVSVAVDAQPAGEGKILAAFAHDQGFLRTQLARRLSVRYVPRLTFVLARATATPCGESVPQRGCGD